ncbi:MAG: GTP cyclohydrolase I, partial [Neolewinella sp.]
MSDARSNDRSGNDSSFRDSVARMLQELDPEPQREGLVDTPKRVEKAFRAYT